MRRSGVSRAELEALRNRVPETPALVLVVRTIVYPGPDGLLPVVPPRTAAQVAAIAAAEAEMRATKRSRRIVLGGADVG